MEHRVVLGAVLGARIGRVRQPEDATRLGRVAPLVVAAGALVLLVVLVSDLVDAVRVELPSGGYVWDTARVYAQH